jgi:hypothetical protein
MARRLSTTRRHLYDLRLRLRPFALGEPGEFG